MILKEEGFYPSADRETQIACTVWKPEGQPVGILQIAHGMVEFIDRYDRFARKMAEQGWLVAGNDHLGHGRSVLSDDRHGYFSGEDSLKVLLEDMQTLRGRLRQDWPGVPYFLMGHSMGSFLTRAYIQQYGKGLSGVIIMGTGSQPGMVPGLGRKICRSIAARKGWTYRSSFVDSMALGSYNKRFEAERMPRAWLTRDKEIVEAYNRHPWNNFVFTLNGYDTLFSAIGTAQSKAGIDRVPKDLPLLLVSGGDDPVGSFGKGVRQAYEAFRQAGIKDVKMKLYPEARHEILNELNHDQVDQDLLDWLNSHLH